MDQNDTRKEEQLRIEAWNIVYPALIFIKELKVLTPATLDVIERAVNHYNQRET